MVSFGVQINAINYNAAPNGVLSTSFCTCKYMTGIHRRRATILARLTLSNREGLEQGADGTVRKVGPGLVHLDVIVVLLAGDHHASTALEIHLVNRDVKPPVSGVDLPEQVEANDDRRSEILLEEDLRVGRGIGARLWHWLAIEKMMRVESIYIYMYIPQERQVGKVLT